MKSIVEQASSVMKAIEKGWAQAGKPQEFSIKIFEVEQKNFLGMTSKPAKIAIFYGPGVQKPTDQTGKDRSYNNEAPRDRYERKPQDNRQQRPLRQGQPQPSRQSPDQKQQAPRDRGYERSPERPPQRPERPVQEKPAIERPPRETWTPEMIDAAGAWLTQTLQLSNLGHNKFNVETKNYYLKFNFDGPLMENTERERLLFRSLAHLLMQSLRNKFKKGFRGFKIILNTSKV